MMKYSLPIFALLLFGCTQLPKFNTQGVNSRLLPTQVASSPEAHRSQQVMWGGTILSGNNLKSTTQLEVLAYPLDSDGWPMRDQKPLGRFIASSKGYLETADYSTGRLITVIGSVSGSKEGKVGDSTYTFPLITVNQLHLWQQTDRKPGTRFHFGIGVILH